MTHCSSKLYFWFNISEAKSQTVVLNPSSTDYLAHSFISVPIYDACNIMIGYKVSDDYIQQIAESKYAVRINSTYFIEGKGTINWSYEFINDAPNYYYPSEKLLSSTITSATGIYECLTGNVYLWADQGAGYRYVTIMFNNSKSYCCSSCSSTSCTCGSSSRFSKSKRW